MRTSDKDQQMILDMVRRNGGSVNGQQVPSQGIVPASTNQKRSGTNARRSNKFNAKKKTVDGIKFDSLKEARRYEELKALHQAGEIQWFAIKPVYMLEGGVKYEPDFLVMNLDGSIDVEDVKGGNATKTRVYINKRKQMRERYGIHVVER